MTAAKDIEQAIRVVFAQSKSLAERSAIASGYNDEAAANKLLDRANYLLRACQYLEVDLGRRIVSNPPPAGRVGIQPVVIADRAIVQEVAADHVGKIWCDQCDERVSRKKADFCNSKFCPVRP